MYGMSRGVAHGGVAGFSLRRCPTRTEQTHVVETRFIASFVYSQDALLQAYQKICHVLYFMYKLYFELWITPEMA